MRYMPIEAVLAWAYHDQMVHAARPSGTPVELGDSARRPRLAVVEFGADAIDESAHVDFEAHPDAYIVHRAVSALKAIRCERTADEIEMLTSRRLVEQEVRADGKAVELSYRTRRADGSASIERIAGLTNTEIHQALAAMPAIVVRPRDLVFHHAQRRSRPDPIRDPIYCYDRGATFFADRGRRWGWTMLLWNGDDPLQVVAARRQYAVWWQALRGLKSRLSGALISITITEEMPPDPQPVGCA